VGDISEWLEGLGLGKYTDLFERNEIDLDSLPYLTEEMVTQLGLPIGARAKLLRAASHLPTVSRLDVDHPVEAHSRDRQADRFRNQRRQVTVMFCDLVDSTKLAACLDPEDLGAIFSAYQKACGRIIAQYEGHIEQYLGDGIEVIFGWPVAQEDGAERALRAGLQVIQTVTTLPSPRPLAVRIGISTGVVLTGTAASPSSLVGEVLHLAARLQSIARPNSIVISQSTHQLVSARFNCDDLGLQRLKGFPDPIRAFRVRRLREDKSRFQARTSKALTNFVGRAPELGFLNQRWHESSDGEGQAVFVSGIPGIGKSRIVYEFSKSIAGEDHLALSFQCLPHAMQSALFPVSQRIERLTKLRSDDSDDLKLAKLERLILQTPLPVERVVPFVANLMSIPTRDRYPQLDLSGQQLKSQTLFVLIELVLQLSIKRPIFCVLEDAHWIDPSTQELLDLLIGQIQKGRILLVVTHRPEYQLSSNARANASGLNISRLGRRDLTSMAQFALRGKSLSTSVMRRIIEESDSVPLFVEELVRGAIELDGINKSDLPNQPGSSAPHLVPISLRDSLMARLDRAPQARNVAQVAAVIGREFSVELLQRCVTLSGSDLSLALEHLKQSDILQLVDAGFSITYTFKHALLRDAAYDSLLRSTRKEIHATLASVLEKEFPELVSSQPELLAYHYSYGARPELALQHWVLAGYRARARSANLEAIALFENALKCLDALPKSSERIPTELEIHMSLGLCSIAVNGYSSEDTRNAFERAYGLSVDGGDDDKETQAIFGLWGHYWMKASHDRAMKLAERLVAKAEEKRDPVLQIVGCRCLGSTLFTLGEFVRARKYLEEAISRQVANVSALTSFAVDPRIAAQLMLAWNMWILGFPEQARINVLQALAKAVEMADPYTTAFAHYVTSAVHLLRGETGDAILHADRSLELSREHGINLYALYSRFGRGCALTMAGEREAGLFEIVQGIDEAQRANLGYMRSFMLGWLGIAQAANGDPEAALSTINGGIKGLDDVAGRAWEAELYRLYGDILLRARPDAVGVAERAYNDAIVTAQRQGARSLELRATTSLASLLRRLGRSEEGYERLTRIYGWFSEGLDTSDLRDARALLAALRRNGGRTQPGKISQSKRRLAANRRPPAS
jgi:class 3 adenylate cyclase/tetratricopeptide (TPR) repeat protein